MVVIGIDPGYAIVGYGIISYSGNKFNTIAYGAVTTTAGLDFSIRLKRIYDDITQLLIEYKPDAMAIEKLFFNNNAKTAIDVAQARGVILLAAMNLNIPVYEYTPLQVKQAVVGYGRAVKSQVMEMTRVLLHLDSVPKLDDTADALAMAICHAHTNHSLIKGYKLPR